jgi:hypothetical protein
MAILTHFKQFILSTVLIVCLLPAQSGSAELRSKLVDEYQVKAAFILNFARLTQWPPAENQASETLNICVMGNETLKSTFTMVSNQKINDRLSQLIIISRAHDIKQCHVLMIGGIKPGIMRQIFKSARTHSILTISELSDITQSGAILNFIREDNKIKFQINHSNAQSSGLKISSRLLKLAIIKNG